jgi:5-methylthioribose kinase
MEQKGVFRKYAYAWLTVGFFLVSFVLHWWFGWYAYQAEETQHGRSPETQGYLVEMLRDTMENWQSEFLQLLWQVVGLAYFLYVGSPASKENDDRLEAKVDALLRIVGGENGGRLIDDLDAQYLRTSGHPKPHAHETKLAQQAGSEVRHVAQR